MEVGALLNDAFKEYEVFSNMITTLHVCIAGAHLNCFTDMAVNVRLQQLCSP